MNSTDEVPSGSQTLNGECLRQPACTNIQETYAYNNRMQMAVAELGTSSSHTSDSCREYSYDAHTVPSGCSESSSAWPTGTTNNGNVGGYYYADSANTGLSHPAAYTYDGVNRLIGAAATGNASYSQAYSYDIYGNLNCSPSGPGCVTFSYNPNTNTNQITTSGYSYDPAGNLIGDGMYTYQWDAEAHLTAVYQSGNVVSLNTYNALGQRVEDIASTNTTDEAYGAGGDLLLRYTGDSNSRSFVPFNGRLLAEYYCGGMIFDHPDEIGSATTATDCTGNNVQERLYYPFGEFWTGVNPDNLGMHQEFAKLPDYDPETETGLYNTANRHYSPTGRWMSPDPANAGADPTDPQTWNMYAYVRNNPTTNVDPDGLGMDCTQDWNGNIQCTVTNAAEDDFPKEMMQLGDIAIPQEELGPWMPLVGAGLIAAGWCMQTHCVTNLTNLLSQSKKAPPPPAAAPVVPNTASPNPPGGPGKKVDTPKSNPEKFRPIRGTSAKLNTETGEVFQRDLSQHGGDHYEVYKNLRDFQNGIRDYQVWADGTVGKSY